MILGLPVISTDCSGPNELLNYGEFGLLVKNDVNSLYQGIKELLIDTNKLEQYKKKSCKRVEFFDYHKRINDIEELFLIEKEI